MKKKKSLIVGHDFFWENSSFFGVFGSRRGLQASLQPGNQKRSKWSNTAYLNKRSFIFKIKFCVFQVTKTQFLKKVVRIFNARPVKIPQLKTLLTRKQARWPYLFIAFFFLMFIHECWLCKVSKKNLIVETVWVKIKIGLTWLATPDPIPSFLKTVDWLQLQPKGLNIL